MVDLVINRCEYDKVKENIKNCSWVDLIPVFNTYEKNTAYLKRDLIGFFIATSNYKRYLILNGHFRSDFFKLNIPTYKIRYLHTAKYFYSKGINNFIDMEMSYWIDTSKSLELFKRNPIYSKFRNFYKSYDGGIIKYIPETVLAYLFDEFYSHFIKSINPKNYKYKLIYNQYVKDLSTLDSNGVHIDKKKFLRKFELIEQAGVVYPDYTFFNLTGRPNGANGEVNFSALKKDKESRDWLISRHKKGLLVEVDFTSYHLYLIADIIGYRGFKNRNVYEYMSEQLYGLKTLSNASYNKIKRQVFQALYSDIELEVSALKFFQSLVAFKEELYEKHKNNRYILSYKETRKIKVDDPSPSKVFNYYLQCYETDNSMQVLNKLNRLLNNKNSKVILYTYDSFLIDFDKSEGKDLLYQILECFNLPVKVTIGESYYKMKNVVI